MTNNRRDTRTSDSTDERMRQYLRNRNHTVSYLRRSELIKAYVQARMIETIQRHRNN